MGSHPEVAARLEQLQQDYAAHIQAELEERDRVPKPASKGK